MSDVFEAYWSEFGVGVDLRHLVVERNMRPSRIEIAREEPVEIVARDSRQWVSGVAGIGSMVAWVAGGALWVAAYQPTLYH